MSDTLIESASSAVPITPVAEAAFTQWIAEQPAALQGWTATTGFQGKAGTLSLVPGPEGALARVLFGVPDKPTLWDWAPLAVDLPVGTYAIDGALPADQATDLALAWRIAQYRFDRYKSNDKGRPSLVVPNGADVTHARRTARFTNMVRDLINTPAADMGPDSLAAAAEALAGEYGAECHVTVGDDLIRDNFPAIHAVGRAHDRAPRLIDIRWGDPSAPKVTLVGKGVCFDTGGLDIKAASGMKLMRKDMGGGAHVLGIAGMIMDSNLPVRLRVLVPAVENSIASNAMRPGDVVMTRKGLTIEIDNTDAEGRVILADALAEAASETPEMIVDFATLTGAARVALGTELPALFCNDDALATALLAAGQARTDPFWRMPLWPGYVKMVKGKFADLTNSPEGGYGGSITAALFLEHFVSPAIPWAHIDLMAWNPSTRPGRPEGGEAMGLRAVYHAITERFGVGA
ncbi:MAG: leucyl aminopeptidase family protein [Rhodospirillaceae bacterium]